MNRRQFPRSPAEYSSGAARTPWLLDRMRDAAAFARRSAHRKREAAMDTVPAIEDQLHTLQPICSAQRVSTGITCGAPAVAVAEIHAIDGCDQMGLSPDGDRRRDALPSLPGYCAMGDGHLRGRQTRDGVPTRHPPGVQHLRASHSIPAQCLHSCARSGPSDWHHDPTTHRRPVCGCGGR